MKNYPEGIFNQKITNFWIENTSEFISTFRHQTVLSADRYLSFRLSHSSVLLETNNNNSDIDLKIIQSSIISMTRKTPFSDCEDRQQATASFLRISSTKLAAETRKEIL